jgi:3-hydroxyisobutyrate dehydrogenase-like beta-hydroxyacid dehydrogenase
MNKEFRLILRLAREVHAPIDATSVSFQISSQAPAAHGHQDFSAVMKFMQELSTAKLAGQSIAG